MKKFFYALTILSFAFSFNIQAQETDDYPGLNQGRYPYVPSYTKYITWSTEDFRYTYQFSYLSEPISTIGEAFTEEENWAIQLDRTTFPQLTNGVKYGVLIHFAGDNEGGSEVWYDLGSQFEYQEYFIPGDPEMSIPDEGDYGSLCYDGMNFYHIAQDAPLPNIEDYGDPAEYPEDAEFWSKCIFNPSDYCWFGANDNRITFRIYQLQQSQQEPEE